MSSDSRRLGVIGLMESPEFVRRLLARILAHRGFCEEQGYETLVLELESDIPPAYLEARARVVHVRQDGTMRTALVYVAGRLDDDYRLLLNPWRSFIDRTSFGDVKHSPGIYIWLGECWHHVPSTRVDE